MTLVLADTSVWQRVAQPAVAAAFADAFEHDALAMVVPVEIELLRSAVGSADYAALREEYGALHRLPFSGEIAERAVHVQGRLALRGYHRGPSATDLLAAAAAEAADAELWHCDRHFELIADVTGQPMQRVGR